MARILDRSSGLARGRDMRSVDAALEANTIRGRANRTTAGTFPIDRWREPGRYNGPFAWSFVAGAVQKIRIGQGFIRLGQAHANWPTKLQSTGAWPIASPDEFDWSALAPDDWVLAMAMDVNSTSGFFDYSTANYPRLVAVSFAAMPSEIFDSSTGRILRWPIMSFTITSAGGISKPRQRWHGDIIFPTGLASATYVVASVFTAAP